MRFTFGQIVAKASAKPSGVRAHQHSRSSPMRNAHSCEAAPQLHLGTISQLERDAKFFITDERDCTGQESPATTNTYDRLMRGGACMAKLAGL